MQIADLITCWRCGASRPPSDFYPSRLKRNDRRCRQCDADAREQRLARMTPEEREALRERHRDANLRHRLSGGRMRRAHGITLNQFEAMEEDQGGVCAICQGPPCGPGSRLHIDHDHETGRVRGLLCGNCNTALGLLKDDPERMLRMIAYLGGGPDSNR